MGRTSRFWSSRTRFESLPPQLAVPSEPHANMCSHATVLRSRSARGDRGVDQLVAGAAAARAARGRRQPRGAEAVGRAVWGISTEHFAPYAHVGAQLANRLIPLEEVLVERSSYSRQSLKRRLFEDGLKARACELCGQGEIWRGQRMSLILDHVNGVHDDNRLENLRIVCPNCAATLRDALLAQPAAPSCPTCGREFRREERRQRYCSQACWQASPECRAASRTRGGARCERPSYEQLLADLRRAELGRRRGEVRRVRQRGAQVAAALRGGAGACRSAARRARTNGRIRCTAIAATFRRRCALSLAAVTAAALLVPAPAASPAIRSCRSGRCGPGCSAPATRSCAGPR